jgi:hypothetical protein
MLHQFKAAALGAVLSINVLTQSAPANALEAGLPESAQTLGANMAIPEPSTVTRPSLPDDMPAAEKPSRAARWVVFDFLTGIKTIEFADGSLHEELFEPEPLMQIVLSTVPSQVPPDAAVTGSLSSARR